MLHGCRDKRRYVYIPNISLSAVPQTTGALTVNGATSKYTSIGKIKMRFIIRLLKHQLFWLFMIIKHKPSFYPEPIWHYIKFACEMVVYHIKNKTEL